MSPTSVPSSTTGRYRTPWCRTAIAASRTLAALCGLSGSSLGIGTADLRGARRVRERPTWSPALGCWPGTCTTRPGSAAPQGRLRIHAIPRLEEVDMASEQTVPPRDSGRRAVLPWRVHQLMRPATTTVERTAHLAAAAYLMKHRGDTALVVTTDDDDRTPIAVITDADISQAVADGRALECTRISDLHLPVPITVREDTSADDATRLMLSRRIHHLPVVHGGRLVGMVDLSDLCRPLLGT